MPAAMILEPMDRRSISDYAATQYEYRRNGNLPGSRSYGDLLQMLLHDIPTPQALASLQALLYEAIELEGSYAETSATRSEFAAREECYDECIGLLNGTLHIVKSSSFETEVLWKIHTKPEEPICYEANLTIVTSPTRLVTVTLIDEEGRARELSCGREGGSALIYRQDNPEQQVAWYTGQIFLWEGEHLHIRQRNDQITVHYVEYVVQNAQIQELD